MTPGGPEDAALDPVGAGHPLGGRLPGERLPRLVLRVDGGARIGTGHLMRCLALAQAWRDAGGGVMVAVADAPDLLLDRLRAEGAGIVRLPARHPDTDDARVTRRLASSSQTALVVDGPHLDVTFLDALGPVADRTLLIDDLAEQPRYPVAAILNQNAHADAADYPAGPKVVAGLRYVLLRREFRVFTRPRRMIPAVARRLLVTFGGADPHGLTGTSVDWIARSGMHRELEVVVVVGSANPDADKVTMKASAQGMLPVLAAEDMADQMAQADLCITSGGTTVWELARMGLPSLVVEAGPSEPRLVAGLRRLGLFRPLGSAGELDESTMVHEVRDAITNAAWRAEMAALGPQLVDGRGAQRVAAIVARLCNETLPEVQ